MAKIKHLQIGDVFFTIEGFKVCCQKVRAIALQPDNSIIYNWKHREDEIFLNLSDVEKALNKYMNDTLEKALNDATKGGE